MIYEIKYIVNKDFSGNIKKIDDFKDIKDIPKNTIALIKEPNPDIILLFNKVKAFIVEKGGALSHFAIICLENNIPIVKLENASQKLNENDSIIVKEGKIYVNED
jgi:phosphohistidine swiveling domain-containing protein